MDAVVERVIHSTADFEFADLTKASDGAIVSGVQALQHGCPIITDVNMVKVGISAPRLAQFGSTVQCMVASDEVRERAETDGTTRSAMGMRIAAERGLLAGSIIAIGNAPTALHEVVRLVEAGERPALVVGVPVGFVGTVESKTALMEQTAVSWIVTTGFKGGSTIAVAVVNALLRLAGGASSAEIDS
jgi:precorrin-8X/cobalt-precorrin-8 methylmutase